MHTTTTMGNKQPTSTLDCVEDSAVHLGFVNSMVSGISVTASHMHIVFPGTGKCISFSESNTLHGLEETNLTLEGMLTGPANVKGNAMT